VKTFYFLMIGAVVMLFLAQIFIMEHQKWHAIGCVIVAAVEAGVAAYIFHIGGVK